MYTVTSQHKKLKIIIFPKRFLQASEKRQYSIHVKQFHHSYRFHITRRFHKSLSILPRPQTQIFASGRRHCIRAIKKLHYFCQMSLGVIHWDLYFAMSPRVHNLGAAYSKEISVQIFVGHTLYLNAAIYAKHVPFVY